MFSMRVLQTKGDFFGCVALESEALQVCEWILVWQVILGRWRSTAFLKSFLLKCSLLLPGPQAGTIKVSPIEFLCVLHIPYNHRASTRSWLQFFYWFILYKLFFPPSPQFLSLWQPCFTQHSHKKLQHMSMSADVHVEVSQNEGWSQLTQATKPT